MNRLVFDIEANGLNEINLNSKGQVIPEVTQVHCLVIKDIDKNEITHYTGMDIGYGVSRLRDADCIIGHNISIYDVPVLERFYGPIQTKQQDTLIISRMMYPERADHPLGGNSLECWGKSLGCLKQDYQGGWEEYSDEMLKYCIQDVEVSHKIWEAQQEFINDNPKSIWLEHEVTRIISNQIVNGFCFNLNAAYDLEEELQYNKISIEDEMRQSFPPLVEERWSEKTGRRLKDKVTIFNPGSRKQIAQRLGDKYGWRPPITEKGNPKVDEAVLRELKFPEAETLIRYFDITKLQGQVSDWIKRATHSRDGRIHGMVNPQGTVTGRMTASQPNLQQVSGDKRARALFIPSAKNVQVGIDASGLEARMLASRMAKYDQGAYAKIILEGDIHSENQHAAGLPTRNDAKTFFYGFLYGAGNEKIGKIIGKNANAGAALKKKFLSRLPALRKVIEDVKAHVDKTGKVKLLDGRLVPCRSQHAALNVQLQGDGAIVMKLAQVLFERKIKDMPVKFMATVHDEWQLECPPEIAEEVGKLGVQALLEAGEKLDCKMPIDGEYQIGKDWSECH
jgi:DNA polymerase I-like protein with 3'-5' exonuclease and polymerase domains